MTEQDRQLGIEICKRWPVDLADVQNIIDFVRSAPSATATPDSKDAARYRWLRDVSVPPHNFYLSVPDEFKDDRYTPHQVDEAIDAAIATRTTDGGFEGKR